MIWKILRIGCHGEILSDVLLFDVAYHVHLEDGHFDLVLLEEVALQNQLCGDPKQQQQQTVVW